VSVDVPADAPSGMAAHTRHAGLTRWISGQVLGDLIAASHDGAEIAGWYRPVGAILGAAPPGRRMDPSRRYVRAVVG